MPTHPAVMAKKDSTTSASSMGRKIESLSLACSAAGVRGSPRKVRLICRMV